MTIPTILAEAAQSPDLAAQAESFAIKLLLGAVSVLASVIALLWRHALGQAKEAKLDSATQIRDLKAEHANQMTTARAETERWQSKFEAEHQGRLTDQKAATEALLRSARENYEVTRHFQSIAEAVKGRLPPPTTG